MQQCDPTCGRYYFENATLSEDTGYGYRLVQSVYTHDVFLIENRTGIAMTLDDIDDELIAVCNEIKARWNASTNENRVCVRVVRVSTL